MEAKKIISFLVCVLFSVFLITTPAWAIDVVSGDKLELKATSNLGVPLHRTSSSSLVGRASDGTVAEVVGTANNQNWVEIKLPNGEERWIVEKYISRVISSQPTKPQAEELPSEPQDNRENTAFKPGQDLLTVAAFNLENLDPGDTERFTPLSQLIVKNLAAPDIIVLTEIQDNDGSQNSQIVEATETYNKLINAIKSVGGPEYIAFDIAPERNADGGQPGGNIRVGYLYQPKRVTLAAGTAGTAIDTVSVLDGPKLSLNPARIEPKNSAFNRSRKPLAAEFLFNNNPIFIVGNHFVSKRSDNDAKRVNQATIVGNFARQLLAEDNNANVIVAGDLNDLNDSETINTLEASGLKNLSDLLPDNDRYTYKFRNRFQQLDYILVSQHLLNDAAAKFDIVHVNVDKPQALSDHDPVLAQFQLPKPSSVVNATVPSTAILPGLSGQALKSQLAAEYKVKNSLGYNRARDYMYGELDNDNGTLRGIYSGYTVQVNPNSSSPRRDAFQGGINAEHSWPQSKGATGIAKSDLHHLFPSRVKINSRRSSLPFADIDDRQTDVWIIKDQELRSIPNVNIDDYSESTGSAFEPREEVKGNIARALFYFYTMYENQADQSFFRQQKATLCKWNSLDPVDAQEIKRSNAIALQQGNENPFVLDSTLVERVYCNQ